MSSELEPPEKKSKIIDINNIYIETIDNCIKQIIGSKKNLQAIISDDFHEPLPLTKVFAGHIKNVKDISRTIQILNEKIPLKELSHLKRVCRKHVILCPETFLQNTSSIQEYIENHVTELKDVFEYFKELNVPALPPRVTKQYNEARKIWSCNFHPNQYHEKLVSDNFFSLCELKIHRKFMEIVFEIAKWYAIHKGVKFDINDIFRNVNVTVVVNPSKYNRIVTIAYDSREDHPMQHSTMLAIDNVAKTQNGGVWFTKHNNSLLPGVENELIYHLKNKFSPLLIELENSRNKNVLQGIKSSKTELGGEKVGPKIDLRREKGDLKIDTHGENSGHKIDSHRENDGHKIDTHGENDGHKMDVHGEEDGHTTYIHGEEGGHKTDMHEEKGGPTTDLKIEKDGPDTNSQKESGGKDEPYLCTGYYIYMLKEPCVMCSMALVHARAKRVFFCLNNSVCGALCSVAKLQTVPSLNHHFEVFTGFL